VIDSRESDQEAKYVTLKHIGYEDSVVNHLTLLRDAAHPDFFDNNVDKRMTRLSKRFFSVKSIDHLESLQLTFSALDSMKGVFKHSTRDFLKVQIKQAITVLHYMCHLTLQSDQYR
jgi:hypothetical protein